MQGGWAAKVCDLHGGMNWLARFFSEPCVQFLGRSSDESALPMNRALLPTPIVGPTETGSPRKAAICCQPFSVSGAAFFVMRLGISEERGLRLNRSEFDRQRAFRVVVGNMVDPTTHRIRTHRPGVVRLQQIRDSFDLGHTRIEP